MSQKVSIQEITKVKPILFSSTSIGSVFRYNDQILLRIDNIEYEGSSYNCINLNTNLYVQVKDSEEVYVYSKVYYKVEE